MTVRVAVDALGGDRAPEEVVAGALEAAGDGIRPILYGPRVLDTGGLELIETTQRIGMDEKPGEAVRGKPESSLVQACRAVGQGEADVVVSAGNTGAMLAAGLLHIRRLPGVFRPAIAVVIPARRGPSVLIDAGANADARAEHLLQFGYMGSIFAEEVLEIRDPDVRLLSIGEEPEKGNALTLEAHGLLAASGLRFRGNVESRGLLDGAADVVVTDGFTGNVSLKISESLADMLGSMIKEELSRDLRSKLGAALALPAFQRFKKRVDYTEMGGAPLLGIDGGAIICHGSSPSKAIKNGVRVAGEWAKSGLNEHIKAALEAEVAHGGREGTRE